MNIKKFKGFRFFGPVVVKGLFDKLIKQWSLFRKMLTVFSRQLFSEKASSQVLDKVLNRSLISEQMISNDVIKVSTNDVIKVSTNFQVCTVYKDCLEKIPCSAMTFVIYIHQFFRISWQKKPPAKKIRFFQTIGQFINYQGPINFRNFLKPLEIHCVLNKEISCFIISWYYFNIIKVPWYKKCFMASTMLGRLLENTFDGVL